MAQTRTKHKPEELGEHIWNADATIVGRVVAIPNPLIQRCHDSLCKLGTLWHLPTINDSIEDGSKCYADTLAVSMSFFALGRTCPAQCFGKDSIGPGCLRGPQTGTVLRGHHVCVARLERLDILCKHRAELASRQARSIP